MSKQRQRARAELEAKQRAAARAKTAERKARGPVDPRRSAAPVRDQRKGKQTVYRQRRFPPLPMWLKAVLALGWIAAVVVILLTVPTWTGRIGFIVIATMLVPLIVILTTDPTLRYR